MDGLRIVKGNTFWTLTEVRALDASGTPIENFDLSECTDMKVYQVTPFKKSTTSFSVLEGNILQVLWYGPNLSMAQYSLDVVGKYNGVDWRFVDANVLEIVGTNADANIPESSFVSEGFYNIQPSQLVILTSIPQVQTDWNETDVKSPAYIKNKPEIPSFIDSVSIVGGDFVIVFSTTSGQQVITLPVSSIFDTSLYYTKTEVNSMLNGVVGQVDTLLRNSVFYTTLYKGQWVEGTYEQGWMVKYEGVLYVAKRTTTNCPVNIDGSVNVDWE